MRTVRPFAGELAQEAAHPLDALGVEAVGRLVEHEHPGIAEQGIGEAEPLPHAEREAADLAARGVGEPDEAEHLVDAGPRDAGGLRVHGEVVGRRATRVEAGCLEHGADRLQRPGELGVGHAADRRRARGGADESEQDPQGGGLAGAVRAEEAGHLSGLDPRVRSRTRR